MARTVLPIIGAAAGSYFFGSAQLGFLAGSVAGGLVDPVVNRGPKIGETGAQTSAEGAPRAIVYGTASVTGNVIATGPLIETTSVETQGKGGPVNETSVAYRSYAIRICEGPIAAVLRVWQDDKLVYDVRPGSHLLVQSAQWLSNKIIYLGTETQLPDIFLALNVSGVGETPAYRGSAYMVCGLEDLTDRRGSIYQYRFEVASTITPPEVGDEVTNTRAVTPAITPQGIFTRYDGELGTTHSASDLQLGIDAYTIDGMASDLSVFETGAIGPVGSWGDPSTTCGRVFLQAGREEWGIFMNGTSGFSGCYLGRNGLQTAVLKPDASFSDYWWSSTSGQWENDGRHIWFSDTHVYVGTIYRNGATPNNLCRWPLTSMGYPCYADAVVNSVTASPGSDFFTHLGKDGKMRVLADGNMRRYSADLVFEHIDVLPFSTSNCHGFGVDGNFAAFVFSAPTTRVDIYRLSDWTLVGSVADGYFLKQRSTRVIFTSDSLFVSVQSGVGDIPSQQTIVRIPYSSSISGAATTLGAIVADIHDRCGIPANKYNVAELTDLVDGLVLAGDYTGADAINTTRGPYFFDKTEYNKKLWYPKRGKPVVATLTIDDLVEEPDTSYREQASELPKKLHLFYQHAASGYAQVKATSSRSSPDARVVGELSVQVPVVLDEDEAAQIADKLHKVAWAEAEGEVVLSVPESFIGLVPSDCIGLSLRGQVRRLRIDQMDYADGLIALTLRHDRQGAYTSDATGVPIPAPTLPPSTIVGDTILAVMDLPARIESEDDLNYLVAGTGASAGWHGWTLQRSLDAGANYQTVDTFTRAAVMGSLVNGIPSSAAGIPDRTNRVRVHLFRAGQVIEGITELQFLTEGGAFALEKPDGSYEVMQYLDANEDSNGIFELSTLHRGRLNSGASAHTAGAKFVLLSDAAHIATQFAWIGQALTHRAPSLGQSPELADPQTRTFVGRSQIEWPVAFLTLARNGSDVISGTWYPRHRFGTDVAPVASRNLRGYRVTLADGVLPAVTFDTDPFDPSVRSFTYDASALGAPVTVSVSAINRITGPGPATTGTV